MVSSEVSCHASEWETHQVSVLSKRKELSTLLWSSALPYNREKSIASLLESHSRHVAAAAVPGTPMLSPDERTRETVAIFFAALRACVSSLRPGTPLLGRVDLEDMAGHYAQR